MFVMYINYMLKDTQNKMYCLKNTKLERQFLERIRSIISSPDLLDLVMCFHEVSDSFKILHFYWMSGFFWSAELLLIKQLMNLSFSLKGTFCDQQHNHFECLYSVIYSIIIYILCPIKLTFFIGCLIQNPLTAYILCEKYFHSLANITIIHMS